ncbi:MAG: T9SS type A sorting domain-containing protein [Bacteroidetes bacterium]|nr:T9SS type A sorting domain-containing protein [Bacteroidota bacterium]
MNRLTQSITTRLASFSLALLGLSTLTQAQVTTAVDCDLMGLVVNIGSQEDFINLYHPGGYLTWPPSENVMEWEFTDSDGNILYQETLVDENFVSFNHDVPITDTMYVSVLLTNDSAIHNGHSVACLIEDYLVWVEIELIPGTFVGSWTLGGSVGQDVSETSGTPQIALADIHIFPQPALDRVTIAGLPASSLLVIRDLSGQVQGQTRTHAAAEVLDVQSLATGVYLLQMYSPLGTPLGTRRMMVVRGH